MKKAHQRALSYTKSRPSFLDLSDEDSEIHRTDLRGFYMMFVLITAFYILISISNKFFSVGYFLEDSFFWAMVSDGKFVAMLWPGVYLYTWLAFLLQKAILLGLPAFPAKIIQHTTQSLMFIFATYLVFSRDWGFSQTLFIIILTFTHFMKMHSYTLVNRDLRREYLNNPKNSAYPANVTFSNYFIFLVTPALVYQVEYPKRQNFRLGYFLLKVALLMTEIICMYVMISENIIPTVFNSKSLSFIDVYLKLIVPCLVCYNLGFLILFEQILNLFGELSYFGDREFYQDWWNSDGFEEFSRKWNRPVHLFLYKHVYLECIEELKYSATTARYVTFMFSSLCHEFLMALICRKITPYLFGLMMFQFPLIVMTKMINKKEFGIYLLWTGLITGPPLLLTLYAKF